jgi:hypothetical protein
MNGTGIFRETNFCFLVFPHLPGIVISLLMKKEENGLHDEGM